MCISVLKGDTFAEKRCETVFPWKSGETCALGFSVQGAEHCIVLTEAGRAAGIQHVQCHTRVWQRQWAELKKY